MTTTMFRGDCNNGGFKCMPGQSCIKVADFYVCQFVATDGPACTDTSCPSGFECVDNGSGKRCSEVSVTTQIFVPTSTGNLPDWLTTPVLAGIVAGGVCFVLLVGGCIVAICCFVCSPNASKSARYSYQPGGDSGNSIVMAEGVVAGTMASWPGNTGTEQTLGTYSHEQGGYGSSMQSNDSPSPYAGASGFQPGGFVAGAVPNSASYSTQDKPTF
jgi:hypothetical protein